MTAVERERRPLDYWLDPQLAAANSEAPSALRVMAANHAQRRGTVGALALLAAVAVLGGLLILAGWHAPAAAAVLAAGLGLGVLAGVLAAHWSRHALRTKAPTASRAPQTMAAGWALWGGAGVLLAVVALVAVLRQPGFEATPRSVGVVLVAVAIPLVALAAVLLVPAYCNEHARDGFRALVARRPDLRERLEEMAASWDHPVYPFGPL